MKKNKTAQKLISLAVAIFLAISQAIPYGFAEAVATQVGDGSWMPTVEIDPKDSPPTPQTGMNENSSSFDGRPVVLDVSDLTTFLLENQKSPLSLVSPEDQESNQSKDAVLKKLLDDFVKSQPPLSKAGDHEESTVLQNDAESDQELYSIYERVSFEDAMYQIRSEYAVAIVLDPNTVTSDQIKKLPTLEAEVSIISLFGELVMFSSGEAEDIRVLSPVMELIKNANFVLHSHLEGNLEIPSMVDFANAVDSDSEEYVVTGKSIVSYNTMGIIDFDVNADELIKIMKNAVMVSPKDSDEARSLLNEFITQMDQLNEQKEYGVQFRSSEGIVNPYQYTLVGLFDDVLLNEFGTSN